MQPSAANGYRRCTATTSATRPPACCRRYPEERPPRGGIGAIAQLEEHLLCKQGVRSSSLLSSTQVRKSFRTNEQRS
jgi:hypothetical protein